MLPNAITTHVWQLHPGDYVVARPTGSGLQILFRTPNDLEMQFHLQEFADEPVLVFQYKGATK